MIVKHGAQPLDVIEHLYIRFNWILKILNVILEQTSVNWSPDSTFVDKAGGTRFSLKPSSSQVVVK